MPGKKTNTDKNSRAAEEAVQRKRSGRAKQVWVWDVEPQPARDIENYKNSGETAHVASHPGIGHWEKAAE